MSGRVNERLLTRFAALDAQLRTHFGQPRLTADFDHRMLSLIDNANSPPRRKRSPLRHNKP